jgi:hypothetical protein
MKEDKWQTSNDKIFEEIFHKVVNDLNNQLAPAEIHLQQIKLVAGKLIAEGLNPHDYTPEKAIEMTSGVAAPRYVEMLIQRHSPLILKEMKKLYINTKFGL